MDPRPTKPDARPAAALDATKPARTSAYEPTVVRARQQPDEPLTDADKFLSPPQETGEVGRLGPYRVLGVLGRGGMGAVYRAEDPRLNRQVAVKVLLPDLAADEHAKARFRREAQAQAKVEHDHIIPIYEVEEANGVVYLAMPLLKGQTLSAALKLNRRPPVAELVRIGREIAEGLAAAHEVGLIHRDIKPANVWLEGAKRRVKILDFGLAREAGAPVDVGAVRGPNAGRADDLTRPGALMGTPAYMSPEQARGQPLDLRSDVFSLGVVLYEMATGRKPFSGASQFDLLAAVATQEPYRAGQIVPDLPPALAALVHRMLAKDPAARPQSCDEVATELEAVARALAVPPVIVMPLHSQAEVQNEPNVWEDLESTYASEPEPEADETAGEDEPAESEAEPAPAPRRVPKWAFAAGGALAALVVLVAVLALPKPQPKDEGAKADPPPVTNKNDKKGTGSEQKKVEQPVPTAVPDHRAAALWVLKQNGTVSVKPDGGAAVEVLALDKLPPGPFVVQSVYLSAAAATDADPAPLAALTNLLKLNIEGPNWTDDRLARVFGALKGAAVQTVTVRNFTQPLVKTGLALGGLKLTALDLQAGAPGAIRAADLRQCVPTNNLKLGGLHDADLDGISEWTVWPKAFDLRKCPKLTGAGLDHIHAAGRPDRALAVLDFDLSETGVTEAEATAFAARFRKSVVKWDGVPLPTVRARRAAQVALDRGAHLWLPSGKRATVADLKADDGLYTLWLATGDSWSASDPKSAWYTPAKGAFAPPASDDELFALLPHLLCQGIHIHHQNLTDTGAARLFRAIRGEGVTKLSLVGCSVGDETLRSLAHYTKLYELNLNGTKVTHAGLAHLAGRLPVSQLRLADTGLTDDAVPALSAFAGLHDLDLKGTKLTDEGITKLRAALPYTIIRDQNGTTHQPARVPLGSALAAKKELFARGCTGGNSGSPVTDPAKWDGSFVNVSLYSGKYRATVTAGNGWEKDERTGPVEKPFDAAELVSLFRVAGFTTFNNWQFVGQNIDDAGAAALLALPGAQRLKGAQFQNCGIGDATAAHLARLPDVIDVFLNSTKVGDAGVKALAEGNPLLRQLRLEGCKGVTNAAIPHLSKLKRLFELDLKGTSITAQGANQLAAALPYTTIRFDPTIQVQKRERPRDPYKSEAATRLLNARGGVVRNQDVVLRAAKHLDPQSPLNGWEVPRADGKVEVPFDDADLLALVGDLLSCDKPVTKLEFLCLNAQAVTDAGFGALARFPAIRTAHNVELIEMQLGDESARALAGFPVLTKLALNGTQVGDAGAKALAAEHYGTLLELRLARTRVTDAAVPDLLKMKWLRVLDLHGTAVSADGAAKLAEGLPKCAIRWGDGKEIVPKK